MKRTLQDIDEVESLYVQSPEKLAALHFSEGYYRENLNPYPLYTGAWNKYENAFFNLKLRDNYE
jgi:hypothetical protein